MEYTSINLEEKFNKFSEYFSPKIIAQMNNYHFKLVKPEPHGAFPWHSHSETDEVFLILEGRLSIEFRNGTVDLNKGEMFVIPKGVEHKPYAHTECKVMLIEPAGILNTGDSGGELTKADEWI